MNHLDCYLKAVEKFTPGISQSLLVSASPLVNKHFNFIQGADSITGLLCGEIQSGKTSHIFSAIASAADKGFPIFILLTTDNIFLYRQTYERAKSEIETMCVCSETDDVPFRNSLGIKPAVIILKKNYRVLKTWCQHLATVRNRSFPIVIIDDEGDVASLNTKVNQKRQSTINYYIERMRTLFQGCIFLQVTATPQALILQTLGSGWRPEFVHCFDPGDAYVGGDILYGDQSTSLRTIPENEGLELTRGSSYPKGLTEAILAFLISGTDSLISGREVCSMLVHPSVRISSHKMAARKIETFIEGIIEDIKKGAFTIRSFLENAWLDLQRTFPEIHSFDEIYGKLKKISKPPRILVINSTTSDEVNYCSGLNILVGGNSLGRGLTIGGLQVVYYTRTAKIPRADTVWQHSRMFGYDRRAGLARIYLTPSLMQLFRELNESNKALLDMLRNGDLEKVSLVLPKGISPTRGNVLDKDELHLVTGGVNYFPFAPQEGQTDALTKVIGASDREISISLDEASEILSLTDSEAYGSWDKDLYCSCLKSLAQYNSARFSRECKLIVRVDRDIARNTGTLLSPDDRILASSIEDKTVLVMYRLTGRKEKGWNGNPFWVPNIKFPKGCCFYRS